MPPNIPVLPRNYFLHNRYRIIRLLGQGGFGHVYEATDETFDKEVALKETLVESDTFKRAFEREAKLLAKLNHSNIPRVTDYFFDSQKQYLVMDLIDGLSLAELLDLRRRPASYEEVLSWAYELLDALNYLHTLEPYPVIHRDIKPPNIRISKKGKVFLVDFGIAKGRIVDRSPEDYAPPSSSLHVLTPAYAPLEQITSAGTDPQSDLFSLGATLYHLMTGRLPAQASERYDKYNKGEGDPLIPAHQWNQDIPEAISSVLLKAMALHSRDRISSATEMHQALLKAASFPPDPILQPSPEPLDLERPLAVQTTKAPARIFICYRREDSGPQAYRLNDWLSNRQFLTFMDIDTIPYGVDFRQAINEELKSCSVFLALIGNQWLTSTRSGQRRLDNPNDLVRLELANALSRGISIIPILVQDANMPSPNDLPDDLKELAYRNALSLNDIKWKDDLERLIRALNRTLSDLEERRKREAAQQAVDEEARKRREETQRKAEEERQRAEREERERKEAEAETLRLAQERETARLSAEEDARQRAAEEAKIRADEEARLKAEKEVQQRAADEARRRDKEARQQVEAERLRQVEEERKQKAHEEAEARRLAAEETEQQLAAAQAKEEARLLAERKATEQCDIDEEDKKRERVLKAQEIGSSEVTQPATPQTEATREVIPPIAAAVETEAVETLPSKIVAESQPLTLKVVPEIYRPMDNPQPKPQLPSQINLKRIVAAGILVLILFGVGVLALLYFVKKPAPPPPRPNTAINTTNINEQPVQPSVSQDFSLKQTVGPQQGTVWSVAFSPKGDLASTGDNNTVRVWETQSWQLKFKLDGHTDIILSTAFSPDGQLLASSSKDKTIRLWNSVDGSPARTLSGHSAQVLSVAFSMDGHTLASASADRTIKLWDTTTGQEIATLKGHQDEVWGVAFSPDGKTLASVGRDDTVRLWDLSTNKQINTLRANKVYDIALSPDGQTIASGHGDNTIKLWNLKTGQIAHTLTGHKGYVISIAFTADGSILASASEDTTIKIWDAKSGALKQTLTGHGGVVQSIAFSPDGQTLISGGRDGTVRVWGR